MPEIEISSQQNRKIRDFLNEAQASPVQSLDNRFIGTGLFMLHDEPLALRVERVFIDSKGNSRLKDTLLCSERHLVELVHKGIIKEDELPQTKIPVIRSARWQPRSATNRE